MKRQAVILAAGKGTRMQSKLPKVMHKLAGKPMLEHVLTTARNFGASQPVVVVGHGADQVTQSINEHITDKSVSFVRQEQQLGTGHAVMQTLPKLLEGAQVLVLYGDVPMVSTAVLQQFSEQVGHADLGILSVSMPEPSGYGRIIKDHTGAVKAVIEEKDATEEQRKITEVNSGIYLVKQELLSRLLPKIDNNNAQKEYLLTDLVGLAAESGARVVSYVLDDPILVSGVNDRAQLATLEREYQSRQASQFLQEGLTLQDPARFDLRGELTFGKDVSIDVNVVMEGQITLEDDVSIGAHCFLKNVSIGAGTRIEPFSHLEDAQVGPDCIIGPYARLRPGSELSKGVKIGNFVETKKVVIGENSKVNHLSYVGDATIGQSVNIGAGTIFCNYDGVNKYHSSIEDNVFIGSNCALVSPIVIGHGATIAAGSTITADAPSGKLTVGRARQTTHPTWQRPEKTK